jgi:hypothetical protein
MVPWIFLDPFYRGLREEQNPVGPKEEKREGRRKKTSRKEKRKKEETAAMTFLKSSQAILAKIGG